MTKATTSRNMITQSAKFLKFGFIFDLQQAIRGGQSPARTEGTKVQTHLWRMVKTNVGVRVGLAKRTPPQVT
jgi:hypothetical protein